MEEKVTKDEFRLDRIAPQNAVEVVSLVNQDVTLGRCPNPEDIADPNNEHHVARQEQKLLISPEKYLGAYASTLTEHDSLVGFMKTSIWTRKDEQGFIRNPIKKYINKILDDFDDMWLLSDIYNQKLSNLGIFGLVISNQLNTDQVEKLSYQFLESADTRAKELGCRATRIVLHDYDPLWSTVLRDGYVKLARGKAAGYSGVDAINQTLLGKKLV